MSIFRKDKFMEWDEYQKIIHQKDEVGFIQKVREQNVKNLEEVSGKEEE